MNELEKIFTQWSRRYRLQRSLRWGSAGLLFGLSMGLGFSLVAVIQQMVLRHEFLILTSASAVVIAGVAAAAGFLWRLKPDYAARTFDRLFGLQERLSTAFEIRSGKLSGNIPQ
ncbi:MAG: hypothetical protein JW726_05785, partial [Anaerolineales bacterium]|nr:hypothetical protein [Anaerolineales bacterium]